MSFADIQALRPKARTSADYAAAITAAEEASALASSRVVTLNAERTAALLTADDDTLRTKEIAALDAQRVVDRLAAMLEAMRAELPAIRLEEQVAEVQAAQDAYAAAAAELRARIENDYRPAVEALCACEDAAAALERMITEATRKRVALVDKAPEAAALLAAMPESPWSLLGEVLALPNGEPFAFKTLAHLNSTWTRNREHQRIDRTIAEDRERQRRAQEALDAREAARPERQLHHRSPGGRWNTAAE